MVHNFTIICNDSLTLINARSNKFNSFFCSMYLKKKGVHVILCYKKCFNYKTVLKPF